MEIPARVNVGTLRRVFCYPCVYGFDKCLISTCCDSGLWQLYGKNYKPVAFHDAVSNFIHALSDPSSVDALATQKTLCQIAENAASVVETGLSEFDSVVLMYLMQTTGDLWLSQDPLRLLNECLVLSHDTQDIWNVRDMIFHAHNAIEKLPHAASPTFYWAALVPDTELDSVLGQYEKDSFVFSRAFISAVSSRKDLQSVVKSAFDLLPDLDSFRSTHVTLIFEMSVEGESNPVVFDVSKLSPHSDISEFLLNPGFAAKVVSFEDCEQSVGTEKSILVKLSFNSDKDFFNSVPTSSEPILKPSNESAGEGAAVAPAAAVMEAVGHPVADDLTASANVTVCQQPPVVSSRVDGENVVDPGVGGKGDRSPTPRKRRHHHEKSMRPDESTGGKKKKKSKKAEQSTSGGAGAEEDSIHSGSSGK